MGTLLSTRIKRRRRVGNARRIRTMIGKGERKVNDFRHCRVMIVSFPMMIVSFLIKNNFVLTDLPLKNMDVSW